MVASVDRDATFPEESMPPAGYSVTEAARLLGRNERTIRKYIAKGWLPARRVRLERGLEYRVTDLTLRPAAERWPDPAPVGPGRHGPDRPGPQARAGEGHGPTSAGPLRAAGDSAALLRTLELLAAERAAAAERDQRMAALEQERFELAGRLGYFQAELEHARETIKALQAPVPEPPEPAPTTIAEPEPPPRRSWWRFW